MNKFKKWAMLLLSLSFLASFSFAMVACEKDPVASNPSESSESSSEPEEEDDSSDDDGNEDDGNDDENVQPPLHTTVNDVNDPEHDWTAWEAIQQPTCSINGIKQRVCKNNSEHVHQAYIAARGHDYTFKNGFCSCGEGPVIPKDEPQITWVNPELDGNIGAGTEYNRYELREGYVEVECQGYDSNGKPYPIWLSFSCDGPGQYALYSIGGAKDTQLKRYDASGQYIPINADGVFDTSDNKFDKYIGFEATMLEDGNHYSTVSCSASMWSTSWRATYSVVGEKGEFLSLRFVKIAEPTWTPSYVKEAVIAKEINDKKAPDGTFGTKATVVPYETDYFYNEEDGYYYMGTKEAPGAPIYVAITAEAPRMLSDKSFAVIQQEGDNLSLPCGMTAEGDYLLKNYCPFIMNDEFYGGTENSYQNYVNVDGLYPVNQELFEFLNLYVNKNKPKEIPDDIWNNKRENAWLAPCYYYANLTPGTKDFPMEVGVGLFQDTTIQWDSKYYTVKNAPAEGQMTNYSYCTLTWDDPDLKITAISCGMVFNTPGKIVFETDGTNGFTFLISDKNGDARDFEITVTEGYAGSQTNPIVWDELGDKTLETIEVLSSAEVSYACMYSWTATANGRIIVTAEEDFYLLVGSNTLLNDGTCILEATEGEVITFSIQAQELITVEANVSFVPAE